MEDLKQIQEFFSKPLDEVTKSQMLKKAKKGSYPATLVAIENGKVVAQEKVNTPQEAPAAHSVMAKKYPNAKIRLEDSTGKILEENVFVEAFKLQKALKGMGYDVKVKAVDDFGTNVFEIYFNNPADADDDSIFYDVEKLGYDNVRVFANPQESVKENSHFEKRLAKMAADEKEKRAKSPSYAAAFKLDVDVEDFFEKGQSYQEFKKRLDKLKEATKEEENEFHKKLDKLVHKTFGHSSDEKKKIAEYIAETIKLGMMVNEELCEKGKRYIKARQAAGEKPSAYLSGRAVRVCKGQIEWPKKGKKK